MNSTRQLVLDALLIAITIAFKEVLSFLPNIEVVTLFLMIFTLNLSLKDSILIALGYSLVESLLYGINIYIISYFMVWLIIVFVTYLLRNKLNSYFKVAILSFLYGLLFDIPFSLPFFMASFKAGISYLLQGVIFSIVHALGNFIVAVILFDQLNHIFKTLLKRAKL